MATIESEIVALKTEIPRILKYRDEYCFSFVCYKYFYNDGHFDFSNLKEIFVDGRSDGGIDLVTIDDISDNEKSLVLIQSKDSTCIKTQQEIIDIFTKMAQTYENFQKNITCKYNDRLRRIFRERIEEIEDSSYTVEFHLFINDNFTDVFLANLFSRLNETESLKQYKTSIFCKNDIEKQIDNINSPKKYVSQGRIKISKSDGILKYSDNGIMVNVYASSIKKLYEMYKDQGLFEQNFRYFIRQKKLDDNIKSTIATKKKDFWFFNNGIIIGCSAFELDGNIVKLTDFSIINGCQTTTIIGENDSLIDANDFLLHCKIVSANQHDDSTFIENIAEASNSQKPIKDRDLRSNRPEQIRLKKLLAEYKPPIYMEIKRGEKKKKADYKWQLISNEYYGQIILSTIYQQPGVARSMKSKIFADSNTYNLVFNNFHDNDTFVDFLKLATYWDDYNNASDPEDAIEESIIGNGKFMVLAIIAFFIKYYRKKIDIKKIINFDIWEIEITHNDLTGHIFSDYQGSDFDVVITSLFSFIVFEIKTIYSLRISAKEETSVSNFFKLDKRYREIILKHFIDRIFKIPIENDRLLNYLKVFQI
jgi:hypothetical protein